MKKPICIILALLVAGGSLFAQSAPKKILNPRDLDKFISDLPKILHDMESLGLTGFEDSDDQDDADASASIPFSRITRKSMDENRKNPQLRTLVAQYGWNERFWDFVYVSIVSLYVISLDEAYGGRAPADIAKQIKTDKATIHVDDYRLVGKEQLRIANALAAADSE